MRNLALWGLGGCALPTQPEPGPPPPQLELAGTSESAPALMLVGGRDQICALESTGRARCFGEWPPPPAVAFQDIAVGEGLSCGVRTDGQPECWGSDPHGFLEDFLRLTEEDPAREVALGIGKACLLLEEGIECVGPDFAGGEEGDFHDLVIGRWGWQSQLESRCALDRDGMLYCDLPTSETDPTFQTFEPTGEGPFVHLVGEDGGICAFREDGTLWCLGSLSDRDMLWSDLAYYGFRTCGIAHDDGRIECWAGSAFLDVPLPGTGFLDLELRGEQICAIDAQGAVVCGKDEPW
jgi:hypothetical protein